MSENYNRGYQVQQGAQPFYQQPVAQRPTPQPQQIQHQGYQRTRRTVTNAKQYNQTEAAPQLPAPVNGESYFDGGLLQQFGYAILGALVTVCTLGICYPWAVCMKYGWKIKHTVINGRRLAFDGRSGQLLGKWILWGFLTIITFGVYSLWVRIALEKWRTKHTHFA